MERPSRLNRHRDYDFETVLSHPVDRVKSVHCFSGVADGDQDL